MLSIETKTQFINWWDTANEEERVNFLREIGVHAHHLTPMRQCCLDSMKQMLKDLAIVFKENDLHYWLDFGALLGIVRAGQLIPYDKDLDIGIYEDDIDKFNEIIPQIREKGYNVEPIIRGDLLSNNRFVPRIHFKPNKPHCSRICACDIFVWKNVIKQPPNISITINCGIPCFCDSAYFERTDWFTWEGVEIKVPVCTKQYLEMRYGKKWRVADPLYYQHHIIGSSAECIK